MTDLSIRRILFPTDLSACAEGAFTHAAWLADRFGATLYDFHVRETPGFPPLDWVDDLVVSAEDVAADLGLPLAPEAEPLRPIDLVHEEREGSDVAAAILRYAADLPADLIVMGTHGRSGVARARLGSIAEAVVRHARCPVLTVRPDASGGASAFREILVALDTADPIPPEAAWAARLARAYHARLHLLSVVAPSLLHPQASEASRRAHLGLGRLEGQLGSEGVPAVVSRVREGDPAAVIAETAEEIGADLIVVGSHGREGVRRALLGSVSETVIRHAPCPVFVARRQGEGSAAKIE